LDTVNQLDQCGGVQYLSYIVDITPSIENAVTYAKLIYEHSRKRQLMSLGESIRNRISDGMKADEIQDYTSSELLRIFDGGSTDTSHTAGKSLKAFVDGLQLRYDGVENKYTTGLKDLDGLVNLTAGRLMVIAARPAMGKSTLGQKIADANLRDGVPVIHFTMEMPHDELMERYVSAVGSVNRTFLQDPVSFPSDQQGEEWSKLATASTVIKEWPLVIDDKSKPSATDVRNKAKAFFRKQAKYTEEGKGLVIIDQLTLMKLEGDNRVHGLGAITKAMKSLAMELKIPVILLHQLNRSVDSRQGDKRPMPSDLRDSGEIEEDADIITFIYRDEVYNEDTMDKGIAELITRKNRGGRTGTVRVAAELHYSRFSNLSGYND